jgi:hypothetical protein
MSRCPLLSGTSGDSVTHLNESATEDAEPRNDEESLVETSPGSRKLIARITENYVFGKVERKFTVDDILAVIEHDFRVRDVPVQIGEVVFDASTTGIEIDQSVSEILSFAAYHGLPKRLTAELLDESLGDPFALAKRVFLKEGWQSVTFSKGLAIQPLESMRRWWFRNPMGAKKHRIQYASKAVGAAALARSPVRQIETPKGFLSKLTDEELTTSVGRPQNDLTFFPSNLPVPRISWRQLRRHMDQASSMIKRKGGAGLLAYATINMVLYSVGMLWHWGRIAPAEVTAASSALNLTARKFCRVFGTVYIVSNLLKIPKLLSIAGLLPLTDRVIKSSQKRIKLPEGRLVILFVSVLTSAWLALMAFPVLSEFARLRKLVILESLMNQYQYAVEPVVLTVV